MSRGPGRCQRRILARLEAAEERAMDLYDLVRAMEAEGFLSSNVRRATRALDRIHEARLHERGPGPRGARVFLPEPTRLLGDDEVFEILKGLPS